MSDLIRRIMLLPNTHGELTMQIGEIEDRLVAAGVSISDLPLRALLYLAQEHGISRHKLMDKSGYAPWTLDRFYAWLELQPEYSPAKGLSPELFRHLPADLITVTGITSFMAAPEPAPVPLCGCGKPLKHLGTCTHRREQAKRRREIEKQEQERKAERIAETVLEALAVDCLADEIERDMKELEQIETKRQIEEAFAQDTGETWDRVGRLIDQQSGSDGPEPPEVFEQKPDYTEAVPKETGPVMVNWSDVPEEIEPQSTGRFRINIIQLELDNADSLTVAEALETVITAMRRF